MIRQRCAIYTRKSTEEGLDQSFNSLDAQREACAAYITSQRHEGWVEMAEHYDDGGYSGGSMDRPGLQRLLEDVRLGRVDIIVVYKVDRLTRALADFARIVDVLDAAGVSFVSVTQAFNTTSSMGRLTLNVLLSFAQFEREVTAERIRDKVAGSKRKGLWMGGAVPIGYAVKDKALIVDEAEAAAVRTIYREYLAQRSVPALAGRLQVLGIVSKTRTDRFGRVTGGAAFSTGALYYLLRNPLYIGKVKHGDLLHAGQHEAIVDSAIWEQVQTLLDGKGGGAISVRRRQVRRWLDGILHDSGGRPMKTTYGLKALATTGGRGKKKYWYYVSKSEGDVGAAKGERVPALPVEAAVRTALVRALADRNWLAGVLVVQGVAAGDIAALTDRAAALLPNITDEAGEGPGAALVPLVARIDLGPGLMKLQINLGALRANGPEHYPLTAHLDEPFALHQNGRARPIVIRAGQDASYRDPDLIALVADARRWAAELLDGRAASVEELTIREGLRAGVISRILPLAWLAPDIAAAILEGRQPSSLTAKHLRTLPDLPLNWADQRVHLGFPAL